jgi:hypothetical protein
MPMTSADNMAARDRFLDLMKIFSPVVCFSLEFVAPAGRFGISLLPPLTLCVDSLMNWTIFVPLGGRLLRLTLDCCFPANPLYRTFYSSAC